MSTNAKTVLEYSMIVLLDVARRISVASFVVNAQLAWLSDNSTSWIAVINREGNSDDLEPSSLVIRPSPLRA